MDMKRKYKAERRATLKPEEVRAFRAQLVRTPDHSQVIGFNVTGKCPSCGHITTQPVSIQIAEDVTLAPGVAEFEEDESTIVEDAIVGALKVRRVFTTDQGVKPVRRPILVCCKCAREHQSAPVGTFGCGSEWMLAIRFTPAGDEPAGEVLEPSADELALWWQIAAHQENSRGGLAAVRSSASLWQKALAGFFTLVSLPALVAGRDAMIKLNSDDVGWITTWVVATLWATAVATYWAHRASLGMPKIVTLFNGADVQSATGSELARAQAARATLRGAIIMTGVALTCSFLALIVLWNADEKISAPKPAGIVIVTRVDDSEVCGELLDPEADGTIRLRPPAERGVAKPIDIPVEAVAKVASPESCP